MAKHKKEYNKTLKVVIAGGRNFNDYDKLKRRCDAVLNDVKLVQVVSGSSKGAGLLGERYAKENGYSIKRFFADWDRWGKSAGYRRNEEMGDYCDVVIVFWDGKSLGTKHMIDITKALNKPLRIFNF